MRTCSTTGCGARKRRVTGPPGLNVAHLAAMALDLSAGILLRNTDSITVTLPPDTVVKQCFTRSVTGVGVDGRFSITYTGLPMLCDTVA